MRNSYKGYHIITTLAFNLAMLAAVFTTDNPLVLFGITIVCVVLFLSSRSISKLKRGAMLFIPFSLITTVVNFIFVEEGNIILFKAFGRSFTLEALIYAVILSLKLLIVIYIFMLLEVMIDSDRAVSYFSVVVPKSTLTLMIAFKLFPTMKERLGSLKEVYSLRGIDFEGGDLKRKVKSYIPVLSILLETSLEGAFDIGEAAYIRGFLSSKRTVYDRQGFRKVDYYMLTSIFTFLTVFIVTKVFRMANFDIYSGIHMYKIFNIGTIFTFISIVQMAFAAVWLSRVERSSLEVA
jgi:energy-coupling factor transport system permease protein